MTAPCAGEVGLQLGLEGLYTGLCSKLDADNSNAGGRLTVGDNPEPGEVFWPEKFGDDGE